MIGKMNKICKCIGIFIIFALLAIAGYLVYLAQTPPPGVAKAETACGLLRGRWIDGAYSFKGIPYAWPPVGEHRWKPPEGPRCWKGVYDATHFRSVCPQVLRNKSKVIGQENCLHLSVWTPSLATPDALPVMVWIHGTDLQVSSGQEKGYSPSEELATQTQTVFISINYRLNAFGFMALETLRDGSSNDTSGNYGILDQIQALRWVQENIHNFGGDPTKITIFGGTSVWALMISALAKGLFHRAIVTSGSLFPNASLESAEKQNMEFLKRSGCHDVACLRKLSVHQVLEAFPQQEFPSWAMEDLKEPVKGKSKGPMTVLDGPVFSTPPFKGSFYNDVPLVVGSTEQETDFSLPWRNISTWTWEDYEWFLKENLRPFGENVVLKALKLYNSSAPCPTIKHCPKRLFNILWSDMKVSCTQNHLAKQAAEVLKSPVYRYLVTYTPSKAVNSSTWLPYPSHFLFHMLDSLAFFGGLKTALGTMTSADKAFQNTLTKYFIHFAKEGKMPADWPEFPSRTALLNEDLSVASEHTAERCSFWKDNGF